MAEVSSGIEAASVTAAPPTIDDDGNCTHHPIIKLKRYNKSTQQWKTILKTCPLCSVRGTTPPRRGARRRRRDKLGSTAISDTAISSCDDKEKDTRQPTLDHKSSSNNSTSISQSVRSDALPPRDKSNQEELNLTQHNPIQEDENDSLSPLKLSLCKQTSNLSVTDTCDVTVASTCSGSTTSFQGSGSSMGIWRYDSIESSGSGGSRSVGDEGKDLQQQNVSPLSMPSSNIVCQPCSNIPPPPIAPPKTDSTRRNRVRAAYNSMHSNPPPPPPPRTIRNGYRRSSTGTSSQNPRGSINIDTPPLSPRRSSYPSQLCQSTLKGGGEVVVCGMSYTNPTTNQRGFYTGQVLCKGGRQVPHGIGTLKYTNVNLGKVEGQWLDGILVDSVEEGREGIRRPFPPPPLPKRRTNAQPTQELNISSELNMSCLSASSSSGMNDNSSWCQPCDDSTSSTPPSPPSYSPRSSHTGSQELQFCSPCSPSPQVEQVPLDRGGRVSLSPRVEIALPLHFKQQKKSQDLSSSSLTQEEEDDDDVGASSSEESDNSLRTYQTRSSKGSSKRSSSYLSPDASYRSARSTGTSRSKRSSYSARESKAAIDIIRTMQF